jgi:hypothetical protein
MHGVDGSGLGGCCPMLWLDRSPSSDTIWIPAGFSKAASSYTCRNGFTRHWLAQGADIRTIQGLLEHSDVKTTMVDTPVLNRGPSGAQRPADLFWGCIGMHKWLSDPHKIPAHYRYTGQNKAATASFSPVARVASGAYTVQNCLVRVVAGPAHSAFAP